MFTHEKPAKCKTCGRDIEAVEIRCVLHQREFLLWLNSSLPLNNTRDTYVPRVDGIKGFERSPIRNHARRAPLIVELQPEARLNFR